MAPSATLSERWSLPPNTDLLEMRREEYQWDEVVNSVAKSSRRDVGALSAVCPEPRTEDAVLRVAEEWIKGDRCRTRELELNLKQASVLLVTAVWLQSVMNIVWLQSDKPLPQLQLAVQGGPGTGKTKTVNYCKELVQRFLGRAATQQCAFMHSAARLVQWGDLTRCLRSADWRSYRKQ